MPVRPKSIWFFCDASRSNFQTSEYTQRGNRSLARLCIPQKCQQRKGFRHGVLFRIPCRHILRCCTRFSPFLFGRSSGIGQVRTCFTKCHGTNLLTEQCRILRISDSSFFQQGDYSRRVCRRSVLRGLMMKAASKIKEDKKQRGVVLLIANGATWSLRFGVPRTFETSKMERPVGIASMRWAASESVT